MSDNPYDIKGTDKCPNCYGTGRVAVGRWGSRPPQGPCPECGGTGKNQNQGEKTDD